MAEGNDTSSRPDDAPSEDAAAPSSQPAEENKEQVLELSLGSKKEMSAELQEGVSSEGDPATEGRDSGDSDAGDSGVADAPADAADTPKTRSGKAKTPNPHADGTDRPIVVDASDHIAGRLSSLVAKMLLKGNRISLVNCERIMISGSRSNTIREYRQFLKINSIINPKHGPVHYRRPDTVITKMIRGMLPFEKKPSGKTSHKRLRAYVGSPKELKPFKKVRFEKAMIRRSASSYTTMGELCRVIGWTE